MGKSEEKTKEIKRNIVALYLLVKSEDCRLITKVMAFMTIAYALSPIDLIPDFIPVLGYLDDLLILPLLIVLTLKTIPKETFEIYKGMVKEDTLEKKWYYAIPIVVVWTLVIVAIISKLKSR